MRGEGVTAATKHGKSGERRQPTSQLCGHGLTSLKIQGQIPDLSCACDVESKSRAEVLYNLSFSVVNENLQCVKIVMTYSAIVDLSAIPLESGVPP